MKDSSLPLELEEPRKPRVRARGRRIYFPRIGEALEADLPETAARIAFVLSAMVGLRPGRSSRMDGSRYPEGSVALVLEAADGIVAALSTIVEAEAATPGSITSARAALVRFWRLRGELVAASRPKEEGE